jgi:hypothetical protein
MTKLLDKALEAARAPADTQDEIARAMLTLAGAKARSRRSTLRTFGPCWRALHKQSAGNFAGDESRASGHTRLVIGSPVGEVSAFLEAFQGF